MARFGWPPGWKQPIESYTAAAANVDKVDKSLSGYFVAHTAL